jgi:hypothetical protein
MPPAVFALVILEIRSHFLSRQWTKIPDFMLPIMAEMTGTHTTMPIK